MALLLLVPLALMASTPSAHAIHFYRGPGGGCVPADGATTDDVGTPGTVGAVVTVGHNTFNDTLTGFDVLPAVIHVKAGQAVKWVWKSAHCHSVLGDAAGSFYSKFVYPTQAPESPQVVPGFFEYPVLDQTPTLSYTHTFTTAGSYAYHCEHHASIGMTGTVIVDP
jgi:plastocyanin